MLRLQEITINECIYAQPNLHEKVVKEIIAKAGQINVKVSDHSLLSNLQRRIKQQEGGKTNLLCRNPGKLAKCFCYNDGKLIWEAILKWKIMGHYNNRYRANS